MAGNQKDYMKENLKASCLLINKTQFLLGAIGLVVGFLIYLVYRPPDQTYFIYNSPINMTLSNFLPKLFNPAGNTLPAFIHAFSFILLTAAFIFPQKKSYLIICLIWLLIDCAFELGQKFSTYSSKMIPDWFAGIPFLKNTENYFYKGTFDVFDLGGIILGTAIAYFVLLATSKRAELS